MPDHSADKPLSIARLHRNKQQMLDEKWSVRADFPSLLQGRCEHTSHVIAHPACRLIAAGLPLRRSFSTSKLTF